MEATSRLSRSRMGEWAIAGVVYGLITGVVFAAFEMMAAMLQGMPAIAPMRMMGAMLLGEQAMEPGYSAFVAVAVAMLIHFPLSAIYGAVFGALSAQSESLRQNRVLLVLAATIFGLALWIVNFYVVAPIAFPWFGMADPIVQFLAHTFFFGTVLGLLFSKKAQR